MNQLAASGSEVPALDPDEVFDLGLAYLSGEGLPIDLAAAHQCFLAAAGAGHLGALLQVGHGLAIGRGVGCDFRAARRVYLAAARRGSEVAGYLLGQMHRRGDGVAADPRRATWWFEWATLRGSDEAARALGAARVVAPAAAGPGRGVRFE